MPSIMSPAWLSEWWVAFWSGPFADEAPKPAPKPAPEQVRHLYGFSLSVLSERMDAEDVTPAMIREAAVRRGAEIAALSDEELARTAGAPFGSYVVAPVVPRVG